MTRGDKFILEQMEAGLRRLQHVRGGDFQAAYMAALAGAHALRPVRRESDAQWVHGRLLALSLWSERQGIA